MNFLDLIMDNLRKNDPQTIEFVRRVIGSLKVTDLGEHDIELLIRLRTEQLELESQSS